MKSFVIFGILFMAWGYWALSGGSDFVPQSRQAVATGTAAAQAGSPAAPQEQGESQIAAQIRAETEAQAAADAARAAELAAQDTSTVAPPVFTSLTDRRDNLAALAAAQAAERAAQAAGATGATVGVEPGEAILRPAEGAAADLRVVDADRVNLRDGPGTDFVAIDQLTNGVIAEVLEYGPGNWVRVQVQGTSQSGWMSSNFLISLN